MVGIQGLDTHGTQSQVNVGTSGGISSQGDDSHQQESDPLFIPQLHRLIEVSFVWDESSDSTCVCGL